MKKIIIILTTIVLFQACKTLTKSQFDFNKSLWTADWSSDNKLIAIGGNINEVQLLSATDLSIIETFKMPHNTVTKIKWHPNKNKIAIVGQWKDASNANNAKARIINVNTKEVQILDNGGARGLAWSPDGTQLAIGGLEGVLSIFDEAGNLIKHIETDQKSITGLSWHPNLETVTTVGSHIEIIDIKTEKSTKIIPRAIEILMLCVAWHPTGEYFVTGDYGDNQLDYPPLLVFWDKDGNKMKTMKGSRAEYRNLAWSNDGQTLITASDKLRLWSKEGKLLKSKGLDSWLWGIDWNEDNSQIVTTSELGEITILNEHLKVIQKTNK